MYFRMNTFGSRRGREIGCVRAPSPCSMFHVSSAPPWPRDWLRCVGPLHVPCVECTPWPRDWLRCVRLENKLNKSLRYLERGADARSRILVRRHSHSRSIAGRAAGPHFSVYFRKKSHRQDKSKRSSSIDLCAYSTHARACAETVHALLTSCVM